MEKELLYDLEDEEGNIIRKEDLSYIDSGCNASVWKYNTKEKTYAVKVFDECITFALTYKVFKKMEKLSFNNIIKVEKTLYNVTHFKEKKKENFDAYMMSFLEEEKQRLLEMKMSLLLQNIENLYNDTLTLSQNKIRMRDVRRANTIMNKKDGMLYLIDVDMFKLEKSKKDLIKTNNLTLLWLLKDIIRTEMRSMQISKSDFEIESEIFIFANAILENDNISLQKLENLISKEKDLKTYFLSRLN